MNRNIEKLTEALKGLHIDVHVHADPEPALPIYKQREKWQDEPFAFEVFQVIENLIRSLSAKRSQLNQVLLAAGVPTGLRAATKLRRNELMSPIEQAIADLTAEVEAEDTVIDSAIAYIQGVPALIEKAVADAVAQGVPPEQLASLTALVDTMKAKQAELEAALSANTPPA